MAARNPKPQTPEPLAEREPACLPSEAAQSVWDAHLASRTHAMKLADRIDEIDTYMAQTREVIANAQANLAKAAADKRDAVAEHAKALARADEMRDMVVEYCGARGMQLPTDPAPEPPARPALIAPPGPVSSVRPLSAAEITDSLDAEYGYLLGLPVKVWVKGSLEVLTGTLARADAEWITLLDDAGAARWSQARSMVERIEPLWPHLYPPDDPRHEHDLDPAGNCRHPSCGFSSEAEHAAGVREYGPVPDADEDPRLPRDMFEPAEGLPEVGEARPGEARALAIRPATSLRLAMGVWLAVRKPVRRHAGQWRALPHRKGSLASGPVLVRPVSSGTVRGVVLHG
jgi:hypothetical protein